MVWLLYLKVQFFCALESYVSPIFPTHLKKICKNWVPCTLSPRQRSPDPARRAAALLALPRSRSGSGLFLTARKEPVEPTQRRSQGIEQGPQRGVLPDVPGFLPLTTRIDT